MRPQREKPSPTVSQGKTSVQESELGKSAESGGVTSTWSREQGGQLNGAQPLLKTDWPAPPDPGDVACFSGLLGVGQTSARTGWAIGLLRSNPVSPSDTSACLCPSRAPPAALSGSPVGKTRRLREKCSENKKEEDRRTLSGKTGCVQAMWLQKERRFLCLK